MNRFYKFIKRPFFIEGIIVFVSLVVVLLYYVNVGLRWFDFNGQWLICKYFIKGFNPYVNMPLEILSHKGLETVPLSFGTSPWGCLLGNLFYAGFLSYNNAKIWLILLYFVAYVIAYIYLIHLCPSRKKLVFILASVGLVTYVFPIISGNAGGIICLLLIMALILKDRHALLSGLCLAFAFVKPQTSLLICLYFLLQRNYKVLFVAALVDIMAWLVVSIHLDVSMLELLKGMLNRNIGSDIHYNGIMTFLAPKYVSLSVTLYLSIIVGVIYSVVLYFYMRYKYGEDKLLLALPFCVGTPLWCYTWGLELMILLPVAAFCLFRYDMADIKQKIFLYTLFILTSFGTIVLLALSKVFGGFIYGMEIYSILCGVAFPFVISYIMRNPCQKKLPLH